MVGIKQWLAAARRGDSQAWDQLHRAFQPYLLSQAQRHLGPNWPERSVRDLVQDTWLRAMTFLHQFKERPDDGQTAVLFRAWLKKILRNRNANVIRGYGAAKRKPQTALVAINAGAANDSSNGFAGDVPGRDLTASKALSQTEEQERVRKALANLPELEREIIRLHVLEGLSMPAIAARLGLSYETVRYHKDEGLRLLGVDLRGFQE